MHREAVAVEAIGVISSETVKIMKKKTVAERATKKFIVVASLHGQGLSVQLDDGGGGGGHQPWRDCV